jgi:hypothetical protein
MSRRNSTSFTPGLRTFISKVLTPVVLVGGVLLLIYFNFSSVLKASQATSNKFNGYVAYSQNDFSYRFQESAGIDRPVLRNAEQELVSYAEWSSTVSVDGNVQELWNNDHGYDVNDAKRQVYSTISGPGWQLIEIVSLVDNHTVTVTFNFDARPSALPAPTHYVFDIAHVSKSSYEWYNYQLGKGTFSALVIAGNGTPVASKPDVFGQLSFVATGDAVPTPTIYTQKDTAISGANGTLNLAHNFYTEYTVTNPSPFRMITLGTETLTFKPGSTGSGAPLPGTVPVAGT